MSAVKWFDVNDIDHIITYSNLHPDQLRRFEDTGNGSIKV